MSDKKSSIHIFAAALTKEDDDDDEGYKNKAYDVKGPESLTYSQTAAAFFQTK